MPNSTRRCFLSSLPLLTGSAFAHCSGPKLDWQSIVIAARQQIGVTVVYDPAYIALDYPGGDIPRSRGVCTDVVIRALREGINYDLQQHVHEDMQANFSAYPKIWGLKRTDRNIDHRRVPNLRTFFKRQGWQLAIHSQLHPSHFLPGDLITCTVPGNRPHIMLVSDRVDATGFPQVIHNIGSGTKEESLLRTFPLTGHYRVTSQSAF